MADDPAGGFINVATGPSAPINKNCFAIKLTDSYTLQATTKMVSFVKTLAALIAA